MRSLIKTDVLSVQRNQQIGKGSNLIKIYLLI